MHIRVVKQDLRDCSDYLSGEHCDVCVTRDTSA